MPVVVLLLVPVWAHAAVSISGTVYSDEGVTTMASGRTVAVSVNGAAAAGTTTTGADGTYTISGITTSAGDVLTLYLDNNTEKGVTVTVGNGSNLTGIDIYQNDLVTRCDNSCSLSATNLNTADNNADTDISAIYTASSNALFTTQAGKGLYIPAGHTFAPGAGSTTTRVSGNFTNRGTYQPGGNNLFQILGTGNLTSGGSSFNAITLQSSGTYTLQDALTATGTITLTSGTLDVSANNYGITFGNNWTGSHGHFIARNGTVTSTNSVNVFSFSSSGAVFYNFVHSGTATINVTTTGLQVTNNFTNSAGNFSTNTVSCTFGGLVTVSGGSFTTSIGTSNVFNGGILVSGGTFTTGSNASGSVAVTDITLTSGTLSPLNTGTFSVSGDWTVTGGTVSAGMNNTVTFVGTGNHTITSAGTHFNNIKLSGTGGTYVLQDALSASGLTLAVGTLDVSSNNYGVTASGSWQGTHGRFNGRSGTVTFSRLAGGRTLNASGSTFYNVVHAGAGTLTLASDLTVGHSFSNTAGTFDASGNNYAISVAGDWTNTGTFNGRSGTVRFNGVNQTMSGSTTFSNLTKTVTSADTLTFAAGTTQTVSNALTLQGAAGNLLSLRSSQVGNQWKIDPQGARTIDYLDVKDSNNVNASAMSPSGHNITNSGNNSNWGFAAAPVLQSFTSTTSNGTYGPDQSVNVTATYDSTLNNGSTMTVVLSNGASVTLSTVSGAAVSGTYTVGATGSGQDSADLTVSSISSESVTSAGGTQTGSSVPSSPNNLGDASNIVIDVTAPAVPGTPDLTSGSDSGLSSTDNITSVTTPTFTASCESAATVSILSGSTVLGTSTCASSTVTITSSALTDATYSLKTRQTDSAGNVSAQSAALSVTIDTTAPSAPGTPDLTSGSDTGSSSTDNITSVTTPSFTASCESSATVSLLSGSTVLGTGTCASSTVTITSSALSDGTYSLKAKQTDSAGNVSAQSAALGITTDTTAPTLAVVTPVTTPTSDSTPDYAFSSTEAGTITYGGDCTSATASASAGNNAVTFTSLSDGTHTNCTITVTDAAGNISSLLSVTAFTVDTSVPSFSSSSSASHGDSGESSGGGGGHGGSRGGAEVMAAKIEAARLALIERFTEQMTASRSEDKENTADDTERLARERDEQAALNREQRMKNRIALHETELAALKKKQEELQEQFALRREERIQAAITRQDHLIAEKEAAKKADEEALAKEQAENRKKREQRLALQHQREKAGAVTEPLEPNEKLHLDRADRKAVAHAAAEDHLEKIAERRGLLLAQVNDQGVLYRDVPTDAWYAPYVASLIENGVAQGYKDDKGNLTGEFGVEKPVTYAEVLKMALEATGKKVQGGSPRNASAKDSWAASYVKEAEDEHLSAFTPSLDVNMPATRGAVIQTLLEVLGITIGRTPPTFSDVPVTHPYAYAISAASFFGLAQGDTGPDGRPLNTFRPDDPINRAEVAKIIALAREVMRK